MTFSWNMARGILICAASAGVGFLLAMKILDKKYAKRAEDEVGSIREHYEKRKRDNMENLSNLITDMTINGASTEELARAIINEKSTITTGVEGFKDALYKFNTVVKNNIVSGSSLNGLRQNPYEEAKRNYNITGKEDSDLFIEEDFEVYEEVEDVESTHPLEKMEPYLIDDEEFTNGCPHYAKLTVYYYINETIVVDENEDIMDGKVDDWWDMLGELGTSGAIWIRDDGLAIDYEVLVHQGSYRDMMLGESYNRNEEDNGED